MKLSRPRDTYVLRPYLQIFLSTVLIGTVTVLILMYYVEVVKRSERALQMTLRNYTGEYLIDTPGCKIVDQDPFDPLSEHLFRNVEEYKPCSNKPLLSYIERSNESVTTLNINRSVTSLYSHYELQCCYSNITRGVTDRKPDDTISISECRYFEGDAVVVEHDLVMVQCKDHLELLVYSNVHAIVHPKFLPTKMNSSQFSVLLIGIDSISKFHLERSMPQTFGFLETNGFVNMKGYSKIEDNTFPNVMAFLSGMNLQQLASKCDYTNRLDDCHNLFQVFKRHGYVTGYGEDNTKIASFNFEKKGFARPPVDFYFRPYMLASEKLGVFWRKKMIYCSGPETSAERVMNAAKDFQSVLKDHPIFGLFWMNSFSHDDLNMPSAMDMKVKEFLTSILHNSNRTIIFFFSDHGMRIGKIRATHWGWFGDKLPFFYVHLPDSFKKLYHRESKNLQANSKRLTNPFYLYLTLQDVLSFATPSYRPDPSMACPNCHSFFASGSDNVTCADAGIAPEWCVCNVSTYLTPPKSVEDAAAQTLVDAVNRALNYSGEREKCYRYSVEKVIFSGAFQFQSNLLLIKLAVKPEAEFEGLIFAYGTTMRMQGAPNRLDRYDVHGWCVSGKIRKFCYCKQ